MEKILKSYLNRLTNLTAKNRSLLLLRLTSDQFIDIHDFNFLNKQPSFSILENLIAGKNVTLCPHADSRDEDVNNSSRKLKHLQRVDKFIYDERGSRDLYVGWPFVRGRFNDGTLVRCPLVFFPVTIEQNQRTWQLVPRAEAGIILNKSFLLAYGHFNEVKIDEDLLERALDDFDTDSTVFRSSLYQVLKDSPVELNFNRDNFRDELEAFQNYKKSDYSDLTKNGELKLFPEAVLGIFPQAGSHLVPDYQELLQNNDLQDIESFFAASNAEIDEMESFRADSFYYLSQVREDRTYTPFPMDAFQENALKAIKMGRSLVVQGPPGTGKSQLIINLISDFIARNKRVLLVCQKRAALDVVFQRMEAIGMAPFMGLVHDFRNDRKQIYEKISKQVERIPEYKLQNASLDSIQIERRFLQVSRRIDQIVEELEEFKTALFDESECGISAKELYLTADLAELSINLRLEYRNFHFDTLLEFERKLRSYLTYAGKFNKPDYALQDRMSFARFKMEDQRNIQTYLDEIPSFANEISEKAKKIIDADLSLDDALFILSKRDFIVELLGALKHKNIYEYFTHMVGFPDKDTDGLSLANTERVIMECYKGHGPETSLPSDQLGKFMEVLQRSMEARKGLIKLVRWELFSKDKYFIKRVLVANGLKSNKEGFNTLVERVDNRLNLEHNLTKVKARPWIKDIPEDYEKGKLQAWFFLQRQAIKAKLIFSGLRNFKEFFNVQNLSYKEFRREIEELFEVLKTIPPKREQWLKYFNDAQISRLTAQPEIAEKLKKIIRADFDSLCEYDQIRESMTETEQQTTKKLLEGRDEVDVDLVLALFLRSLRLAWIDHIEAKFPVLRTVSSMKLRQLEAELQELVREKLSISGDILLMKTRERTYEQVEYNRLNNMVTYRELHHQTSKKRRIWPIRKLINHYEEELFELLPCWMASPESVSALFPMKEMFDLVIFDEASQCFAEHGIPAMFRGKQVLIAGDEKQLRPNDLYRIRWEEEEEYPALEVDSLLKLANHYLMQVQLLGHYRSRSLDLIDFSNRHFYEGRLRLLPDFNVVNAGQPAISFNNVHGTWENNTNLEEAKAVASLVYDLMVKQPEKSIGVVTFNALQQSLVLDEIESYIGQKKRNIPDHLFVKNIENVQGDERDIIIFSTAYGPDPKGKLIMQFGSLNAPGGENRLNVAITRAIWKIYIISSLNPEQLKVENAVNQGPKLLKSYLQYALDVSEGRFKPTSPQNRNHAEWYLKSKLATWAEELKAGWELIEEMPFADLTIKAADRYAGLVITDDDHYYTRVSIKDAHVYTPARLNMQNWKVRTIYSREYWNNEEEVKESLHRFVNQHMASEPKE